MGIFKVIRNTNDGLQYMYNALNYVCYEHTDYDKRYSPNVDIDNAYEQFLLVKRYFYKTSGNPIFHFMQKNLYVQLFLKKEILIIKLLLMN